MTAARAGIAALAAAVSALGLTACASLSSGLSTGSGRTPTGAASVPADHSHRGHRHGLMAVHDPGEVTGTLRGPCHTRHHGELPDRSCTPGAYDPAVNQGDLSTTICRSGYTSKVRPPESQTEKFKFDVAEPAYGQQDVSGELDHLVSLELGGANDAANLWVEAGSIPNPKDAVENALNKAVCDGQVSLRDAQQAIAADWLTAEADLGISH